LTRRVDLPSGRQVVVTDTVGFIQKLPTTLVAAFRATLEEIVEADLIIHVVDTSHPHVLQHIETVEDTLAEIDVPPIPRILVWNKIDLWGERSLPERLSDEPYAAEVSISAQNGTGIIELLAAIEDVLSSRLRKVKLAIPFERGELVSFLFKMGTVESQEYTTDGVVLTVHLPTSLQERFKEYQIPEDIDVQKD
jgi:GTP-binding protein HflX